MPFNFTDFVSKQSNDPNKLYELGQEFYKEGNYQEAFNNFKKAAQQNHASAQYMLGQMYEKGQACRKSIAQAVDVYKKAALLGENRANDALKRLVACNNNISEGLAGNLYIRASQVASSVYNPKPNISSANELVNAIIKQNTDEIKKLLTQGLNKDPDVRDNFSMSQIILANNLNAPETTTKFEEVNTVFDGSNKPINLESTGNSGGESQCYRIKGNNKHIVKIYRTTNSWIIKKITDMVSIPKDKKDLYTKNGIAWPLYLVKNNKGKIIGYVMDKVAANSNLDDVYYSQNISINQKKEICLDMLRKFSILSKDGIIIRDFNSTNFLLDLKNNKSYFIDTDSYRYKDFGSKTIDPDFMFIAPEDIKANNEIEHLVKIDSFYFIIATFIFILFLGTHPYNHVNMPEDSIEIIKKQYYPYRLDENSNQKWKALNPALKFAFYHTFKKNDGLFNKPGNRLSIDIWMDLLKSF